jgi:hypothetical protein
LIESITSLSRYEGGGNRNRETPYDLSNLIPDQNVGEKFLRTLFHNFLCPFWLRETL